MFFYRGLSFSRVFVLSLCGGPSLLLWGDTGGIAFVH